MPEVLLSCCFSPRRMPKRSTSASVSRGGARDPLRAGFGGMLLSVVGGLFSMAFLSFTASSLSQEPDFSQAE
jgi:hypothetical protein